MFKTRLISSIILVIVMVLGLLLGGIPLSLLMLIISVVGMMELYRIYGFHKTPLGIMGYSIAILYYFFIAFGMSSYTEMFLIITAMALMGMYVFSFPKYHANQMLCSFFAFLYVAVMLSYVCRIRMQENGIFLVWLVFICSWINDTCAYLVGISIGKHKMSPKLSPKKSIEGAIGGIAGSGLIGLLYAYILGGHLNIDNALIAIPVACCVGAGVSVIGDLTASAIKRNHEVKDYGTLIPGHGGVLDRFDSVIFTAPMVYFVIWLFTK